MNNTLGYDIAVTKLRKFFKEEKGFTEVPTQSRLSILAACEDPKTISQFVFDGINYPLPQTGQMWLEHELLIKPDLQGVFCVSTSYRNEPNPIPGRHQKIFPMFEFESHGDMKDMIELEKELLIYLNFKEPIKLHYEDACKKYKTLSIEVEHEEDMCKKDSIISLQYFPQRSQPFWNMKYCGKGLYSKVDVIMYGQETIGSAERSCNPDEMYKSFMEISGGKYSSLLFEHFTRGRVLNELEQYLSHDFFPRFGAGIGMTRMVRAMEEGGILNG